jgi:hypothetical protein
MIKKLNRVWCDFMLFIFCHELYKPFCDMYFENIGAEYFKCEVVIKQS